jgi:hypothetical protein
MVSGITSLDFDLAMKRNKEMAEAPKELKMKMIVVEEDLTRKQRIERHAGRIVAELSARALMEMQAQECDITPVFKGAIEWATMLVDEIDKLEE